MCWVKKDLVVKNWKPRRFFGGDWREKKELKCASVVLHGKGGRRVYRVVRTMHQADSSVVVSPCL